MPVFQCGETEVGGTFLFTHHRLKTVLLILACALALFACNSKREPTPEGPVTRELTDDAGRRVSLPIRVNRIISLAPNLTEIVFAVGGGDRLVGRTSYCDYPAAAKSVTEVGDTLNPSLERIVSLRPQVVLISTASQLEVFTQQLQSQNIAVFVTDPQDLEGVFRSIGQIGQMLGLGEQATQVVERLRERTKVVEQAVKNQQPVRVFFQLSGKPLYTAGREAFVTDLMRRGGATSVTADVPGAWPKYSDESALAAKPEAIILPTGGSMGEANASFAEALNSSPAVLQKRVYKINGDHLVRPGPRAIDGLEEIAMALHPESFKQ